MILNVADAWDRCEENCFDYLALALEGRKDEDCFLAELPIKVPEEGNISFWRFALDAWTNPTQVRGDQRPFRHVRFAGRIDGVFHTRDIAKRFAGLLHGVIPTDSSEIEDVTRLGFAEGAIVELGRDVVILEGTGSKGGEIRVWTVSAQLEAIYRIPEADAL